VLYREHELNKSNLRAVMVAVWGLVVEAVQGGDVLLIVTEISKSRAQERKYHVMLKEIAAQVVFTRPGIGQAQQVRYKPDAWKALLVDAFEQEKAAMGEPLAKPGRSIPSIDGSRLVSIRASTKDFRKKEASDFIEFLYARGIEYDVRWSATAEQIAAEAGDKRRLEDGL